MTRSTRLAAFSAALLLVAAIPTFGGSPKAPAISGEYVESRTADVYTGPCFANGEVNLTGREAVMAWHVAQGSWQNVPLTGLSVVAVVRASATLGDPYSKALPARSVFIVDSRATKPQQAALVNFAQSQAKGLLNDVAAVEVQPIQFVIDAHGHHGVARVQAGNLARIATRAISAFDDICHNESVFYQPLAANLTHASPAFSLANEYLGNHLGENWRESGRRGSFVGKFAL